MPTNYRQMANPASHQTLALKRKRREHDRRIVAAMNKPGRDTISPKKKEKGAR